MTLQKLVDVFELNCETADAMFYQFYCFSVDSRLGPGLDREVNKTLFERIVFHVWHGVIKHKYDEEVQDIGRSFLRYLVAEETFKKMIDIAEMFSADEESARSA
jgi:hypothetical protein